MIEQEELVSSSIIKITSFVASHNNGKVLLMVSSVEVLEKKAEIQGKPVSLASEPNKGGKPTSAQPIKSEANVPEPRKPDSSPEPTPAITADVEMKDAAASPTPKGPSLVSSPPTVKKAPESIPKSQGSTSIIPIQGLNPYQSKWTIKARVVAKQGIRTFSKKNGGGESRVLSVNLMDHTCDIKASFWNEAADRYEDTLVVGKCYTFSRGKTQMANRRFNDTKSEYELSFNGDCVVEMCEDSEAPSVAYNFCAIDRLDTMIGKMVDVVGVVLEVSPISEITIKNGADAGKSKSKRNVTLADQSGKQISLTLWDDHAAALSEDDAGRRPILSVRSVRVGDYGGCSLSTSRSSITQVDAKIKGVEELRAWFDASGGSSTFQAVGGASGGGGGGGGPAPRKVVRDIAREKLGSRDKPDVFSLRCTVSFFRNDDGKWQYPSNPENKKKVVLQGSEWVDESTGRSMATCQRRYVLGLQVSDATGSAWCTAFDDTAAQLLRKSADELFDLTEADPTAAAGVWKAAMFRTCVLKVRAKSERYNDEERVKCSLLACDPVNYRNEGHLLLEQIRRYVG